MRGIGPVLLAALSVGACDSAPELSPPPGQQGHFLGIGIYQAGEIWARMSAANRARDAAAANLGDDSHVIVVVDSRTGEIRQCGNFSGHCIGMNPWAGPLGQGQAAPVPLTKHAADLAREAEQQGRPVVIPAEEVEANTAEPAPARR